MTDEQNPYAMPLDQFVEWLEGVQRARAKWADEGKAQNAPPAVKPHLVSHTGAYSRWTSCAAMWRANGWSVMPPEAYGPGCYVIYADGRLVYVGMADKVNVRVSSHMNGRAKALEKALGRKVDSWLVKYRPERFYGERATLELRLIRRLRPVLNRSGNGRKRGDSELPPVNATNYRYVKKVG
jgi:hypothetical protein